ncbi:hypothetical protein NDU88_006212 [Pleurodeles waltl]|uniref:Uncharacterized protein n=1 Tax=Pleurodeles waltl TaxID=8319 RepID=A0AAV7RRC9_PLEWA|nr:hypothetical protein NDU88_006212 [Pleurodeles waltl]
MWTWPEESGALLKAWWDQPVPGGELRESGGAYSGLLAWPRDVLYRLDDWALLHWPIVDAWGLPPHSRSVLGKAPRTCEDGSSTAASVPGDLSHELSNVLCLILTTMQQNLTKIDGKIGSLLYRMDRMSDRIDKHADHLNMAERHLSDIEDERVTSEGAQKQLERDVAALLAKAEDLEGRSRHDRG